jgi:hypothetical protein
MAQDAAVRRKVAQLALDLFDGRITDKQFFSAVDALPVGGDATIAELLELVHHAGARSWFFGVQRRSVRDDGDRIGTLVSELLRSGEGGAGSGAAEARA